MGIPFERCATCDHYLANHERAFDGDKPKGLECIKCGCNDFVMKHEVEHQVRNGPKRIHGVFPLWKLTSYDGTVSGICHYQGKLHYFDMLGAPGSFIGERAYAVFKLTPMERLREWVGWQVFKFMTGDYEKLNEYGADPGKHYALRKNQKYWVLALNIYHFIQHWPRASSRRHYETQPPLGYFTFKDRYDDEDEET